MKQLLHRTLCLFLCAVLTMGMIPAMTASAEENTAEQEVEGYLWTGEHTDNPYVPSTFTIAREISPGVEPPVRTERAAAKAPANYSITENGFAGYPTFTTFEDLKELASREYEAEEYETVYYKGEGSLVISEDLTLPENMCLTVWGNRTMVVEQGVTLTTGADGIIYCPNLIVEGVMNVVPGTRLSVDKSLTVTGSLLAQEEIELHQDTRIAGLSNVTFQTIDGYTPCFYTQYSVSSMEALHAALTVAKERSGVKFSHDFRCDFRGDLVFTNALTFPDNTSYVNLGDNIDSITIPSGVTLTVHNMDCNAPVVTVEGKLVNKKWVYFNNCAVTVKGQLVNDGWVEAYDSTLHFASQDTYSGGGFLNIHNDISCVTGLEGNDDLQITDLSDEWQVLWQIRNIAGLARLPAPKNLQWDKHAVESEDGAITRFDRKGAFIWSPGDTGLYLIYQFRLYKDDTLYWQTYFSHDPEKPIPQYMGFDLGTALALESGTYYFTLQAQSDSIEYYDSKIVTSGTWTYTKPTSRVARPTVLSWDGPVAKWEPARTSYSSHQIEVFWTYEGAEDTNQLFIDWGYDMTEYEIPAYMMSVFGTFDEAIDFTFRVRTLSDDITRKDHSAWSKMSPVFHYTGEEKPSAPTIEVSADPATGEPVLSWKRVPLSGQYIIYRSTSKSGTYSKLDTVTSLDKACSYTDTTAKAGTKYYYKLRAVSYGNVKSSYSNTVSFLGKLAQPKVSISYSASSGKPIVKWETVEGAEKYFIYRSTKKTSGYTRVKTAVSARSYTDTDAVAGTNYYYKVKAIHEDKDANSPYSEVVNRVCDLKRPSVTIKNSTSGYPYLKWSEISGAKKYYVYRATSKGGTYKFLDSTTALKFTDKTAQEGKTYYYKVKAVHSNTAANSAYSAIKYITAR